MEPARHAFFLKDWFVEPSLYRLTRNGESVDIEPKMMGVLLCLAARPGQVVHRDDLLESVWEDTVVTDHVLNRSISELRKVFGDDPRQPGFIETIPKAGYRLIAPVHPAGPASPAWRTPSSDGASQALVAPLGPAGPRTAEELDLQPSPTFSAPRRRFAVSRRSLAVLLLSGVVLAGLVGFALFQRAPAPLSAVVTTPLTSLPGIERNVTFSPDGSKAAFAWTGEADEGLDLYIKWVESEELLRLTTTDAIELAPSWSPDGRHIAFVRLDADTCSIMLISALGGPERRLTDCGLPMPATSVAWSPDGKQLVFSERTKIDLPYHLVLLSLDTLERERLTDPERHNYGDVSPAFSPDGSTLAFIRGFGVGVMELASMTMRDRSVAQLTSSRRSILGATWNADGTTLFFASDLGGEYGLWTISRKGGSPRPVPLSGGQVMRPVFVAATHRLAYEVWQQNTDIWQMPLTGEADAMPERLIASTRSDYYPSLSPDGRRIAFVSMRSGNNEIWLTDRDGSHPVQITSLEAASMSRPYWDSDSRRLLFSASLEGQYDVYLADVEARHVRRLTAHADHDLATGFSRDGAHMYFSSERTGAWQLWRLTGDEAATQLTTEGAYLSAESEDGTTLYYSKANHAGLWSRPVDRSEERRVVDDLHPNDWGNWEVVGPHIYYVARSDSGATLRRFDPATNTTHRLARLPEAPFGTGLTLSPDGRWLLYHYSDQSESDLMLADNF